MSVPAFSVLSVTIPAVKQQRTMTSLNSFITRLLLVIACLLMGPATTHAARALQQQPPPPPQDQLAVDTSALDQQAGAWPLPGSTTSGDGWSYTTKTQYLGPSSSFVSSSNVCAGTVTSCAASSSNRQVIATAAPNNTPRASQCTCYAFNTGSQPVPSSTLNCYAYCHV